MLSLKVNKGEERIQKTSRKRYKKEREREHK
jgi:hypothetical protein